MSIVVAFVVGVWVGAIATAFIVDALLSMPEEEAE